MKKILLFTVVTLLGFGNLKAQDAMSYLKKAKKAFDKYQQSDDKDKLEDAYQHIEKSLQQADKLDDKKSTRVWMKAGEIFNEVALNDYNLYLVNNNHKPLHPNASFKAYEAYRNTYAKADKKWDKTKALDELLRTATFVSNEGIVQYNIESYNEAYQSFKKVLEIKAYLKDNGHSGILRTKKAYNEHLFRTALAAQKTGANDDAIKHFEALKTAKYQDAAVYTSLSKLYSDKGALDKADQVMQEGNNIFPNDKNMLVAEVNRLLAAKDYAPLAEKLDKAVQNDPKQVELLLVQGNVYDVLQKQAATDGDFAKSNEYFKKALGAFETALLEDDENAEAMYNVGALYYNKASVLTQEIKSLETGDKSADKARTLMAKQAEIMQMLDNALPYFQRSESVQPSDINTLTALKEIYTRKDDSKMANEFTGRVERVNSGEKISSSFF